MLYDEIKNAQLQARKMGDKTKAGLLSVIMSEAAKNSKQPSDDEVYTCLKKLRASAEEMLKHNPNEENLKKEYSIISSYLPTSLTEEQLNSALQTDCKGMEISMKNMKTIKSKLEELYPGQIDGAVLAKVVKNVA